ncbi:ECF transporter S component [Microbacterium sp.]|uniref:ECF transporter S component n=1 Tax=Microbacterium sp. TaxID=51671 RepID=UPI003C754F6E
MARTPILSTRVLLVCAAIGVATGIVGGVAGLVTPVLLATPLAIAYGFVLGAHVLPGIVAQEVLRMPLVAILTHVLAALVATAFNPVWAGRFIGTALLFGAIQEGVAALTRYRAWGAWRFFVSAVIIGLVVALAVFFAAHLGAFPLWAQIAYLALSVLGPIVWTAIGLGVGAALRRAGVARQTVRR